MWTILCRYFVVCARCRSTNSLMVIRLPATGTVAADAGACVGEGDVEATDVAGEGVGADGAGGASFTRLPFENLDDFESMSADESFDIFELAGSNILILLS